MPSPPPKPSAELYLTGSLAVQQECLGKYTLVSGRKVCGYYPVWKHNGKDRAPLSKKIRSIFAARDESRVHVAIVEADIVSASRGRRRPCQAPRCLTQMGRLGAVSSRLVKSDRLEMRCLLARLPVSRMWRSPMAATRCFSRTT